MPSPLRRIGLLAALGTLALGLLWVPRASAQDIFYLQNDTAYAQLSGQWSPINGPPPCIDNAFVPNGPKFAFTFLPGDSGALTLDQNPGDLCVGSLEGYGGTSGGVDVLPGDVPYGTWSWQPVDPIVGDASLTCSVNPFGAPAVNYVASADLAAGNYVCTVSDATSIPAASFVSTAAPLRNGAAVADVQLFPAGPIASGKGTLPPPSRRGRYEIVLRDRHGRVHGRAEATILWRYPRTVRVPMDRALRRRVREKGFVRLEARIKRIDGKPGTGDRAKLSVMRDNSRLPF